MITLTSPSPFQFGAVTVQEGDQVALNFSRDDASAAQDVYVAWRSINGDQSGKFAGVNLNQLILVHWDAGDASTKTVNLQTAEDNIVGASPFTIVNFDLIPAGGVASGDFYALGQQRPEFQISIIEDDVPNVSVSLIGGARGTMTTMVQEGGSVTWHFERTDTSKPMTFELRPGANYTADAQTWWGYDPARPLTVHWDAGDTSARDVTLTAREDYVTGAPGPTIWMLIPQQGVTGFAGPDAPNTNHLDDGGLVTLLQFVNDGAQNTAPVWRFCDIATGGHLYTSNAAERDMAMSAPGIMRFEGVGFTAPAETSGIGLAAVHRFYDPGTNDHHYTTSAAEFEALLHTTGWRYEGVAFTARTEAGAGLEAVHRFFDTGSRTHFFTSDVAERDGILAHAPGWTYEGVAFYVPAPDTAPERTDIRHDDGSRDAVEYDTADTRAWSARTSLFDAQDHLVQRAEVGDDGSRVITHYDVNDSYDWTVWTSTVKHGAHTEWFDYDDGLGSGPTPVWPDSRFRYSYPTYDEEGHLTRILNSSEDYRAPVNTRLTTTLDPHDDQPWAVQVDESGYRVQHYKQVILFDEGGSYVRNNGTGWGGPPNPSDIVIRDAHERLVLQIDQTLEGTYGSPPNDAHLAMDETLGAQRWTETRNVDGEVTHRSADLDNGLRLTLDYSHPSPELISERIMLAELVSGSVAIDVTLTVPADSFHSSALTFA